MISNPTLVVQACVNQLFDDPKYPKLELNKGKRKLAEGAPKAGGSGNTDKGLEAEKKAKIDWDSIDRAAGHVNYPGFALVSPVS